MLPFVRIGSGLNETTGTTVIRCPHSRKRNQTVMNREQSTSITGNDAPENARGEGAVTRAAPAAWHLRRCDRLPAFLPLAAAALGGQRVLVALCELDRRQC